MDQIRAQQIHVILVINNMYKFIDTTVCILLLDKPHTIKTPRA